MLEAVIEQENIDRVLLLDAVALRKAVFADPKRHFVVETLLHQFDLIAGAAGTAITAAENRNALPFREKSLREPYNHWRFAGAADGQISNADHFSTQSLLL